MEASKGTTRRALEPSAKAGSAHSVVASWRVESLTLRLDIFEPPTPRHRTWDLLRASMRSLWPRPASSAFYEVDAASVIKELPLQTTSNPTRRP